MVVPGPDRSVDAPQAGREMMTGMFSLGDSAANSITAAGSLPRYRTLYAELLAGGEAAAVQVMCNAL
jgi:hypothetical protein